MVTGYIFSGFLTDEQPLDNGIVLANLNSVYPHEGIGGIITKLEGVPRFDADDKNTKFDSIKIYTDDLKTVHDIATYHFLQSGNRRYIRGEYHNCLHGENRIKWSLDLGLGNFPTVKEIKDGFAFLGNFCGENIWIKLGELNHQFAKFQTHLEIFEANPNGGGWEKGYTYIGPNKVLRAAPSMDAKAILNNIPPEYEIHILGKAKDGWAKVKLKEAKHIFGDMYFKKSIYGKTWEGFIMITEPDGAPLIAPHIFGC